jgi:hypothetical protein
MTAVWKRRLVVHDDKLISGGGNNMIRVWSTDTW